MLDRLNETVAQKIDSEHLRQSQSTIKSELQKEMAILKDDMNLERASRDQRLLERIERAELADERLHDELNQFAEKIKALREERKRDVEETGEFVKEVIDQTRKEHGIDLKGMRDELERIRENLGLKA